MTILLNLFGAWCLLSSAAGACFAIKREGVSALFGTDLLFSLAGIGVLFLLLARMVA